MGDVPPTRTGAATTTRAECAPRTRRHRPASTTAGGGRMIQTTMMTTTTTTMAPTSEDWSWLHPLAAAAGGELLSDARVRALVTVMHDPHTTGAQRTAARNELVTANLRLVIMQAKRFLGHGLPLEDLVQEGT